MLPLPPNSLRWTTADFAACEATDLVVTPNGAELAPEATRGVLTSPPVPLAQPSTDILISWQAQARSRSVLEVTVRAAVENGGDLHWTRWWTLGHWSEDQTLRYSVNGQQDADGAVETDTLVLTRPASYVQWRVTFQRGPSEVSPVLHACVITTEPAPANTPPVWPNGATAIDPLPVPEFSQHAYPDGGAVWCSPTSLSMVLGYWAKTNPVLMPFTGAGVVPARAVPGVYDPVYEGTGNWSFNTAYAASLGLEAFVARLDSIAALAQWVAAGIPVIASIRWRSGELDNAPAEHSEGHLVVVTGFTATGDVIVNDPAARLIMSQTVRRIYRADQFDRAWRGSCHTVYLIYPREYEANRQDAKNA